MSEDQGEIITHFDYILAVPFEYASSGNTPMAETIQLMAPTAKHRRLTGRIKQAFFRSIVQDDGDDGDDKPAAVEPEETEKPTELPTGKVILNTIMLSQVVDFESVLDTAVELFLKVGKIDGKESLKPVHIDRLAQRDLEGMLGQYMRNFILASSEGDQNANS